MKIATEVLERLLVAKELMERVRFHPAEQPDRLTLARQILAAHDAAELVALLPSILDKAFRGEW